MWDPGLVEEALKFVEEHKVGVGEGEGLSPFRQITHHLLLEGREREAEDALATPDSPHDLHSLWSPPQPPPSPSADQFVIFPDAELDHNSNNNHKVRPS